MMAVYSRTNLTAGDIYREAFALIQRNLALCGVGALLMFAVKAGSDLSVRQWLPTASPSAPLFRLSYLPFLWIVRYLLITRLMQAEHLADQGWCIGGLLRYFGAYLLALIGIALGMILLIVPGFIVAIRWTIYTNFVIGRNLAPVQAIKASWDATRGFGGAIFVSLFVLGLAALPGILIARGGFGAPADITTASLIIGNIYTAALGIIGLSVVTGIYSLLVGPDHANYTEVFA